MSEWIYRKLRGIETREFVTIVRADGRKVECEVQRKVECEVQMVNEVNVFRHA